MPACRKSSLLHLQRDLLHQVPTWLKARGAQAGLLPSDLLHLATPSVMTQATDRRERHFCAQSASWVRNPRGPSSEQKHLFLHWKWGGRSLTDDTAEGAHFQLLRGQKELEHLLSLKVHTVGTEQLTSGRAEGDTPTEQACTPEPHC